MSSGERRSISVACKPTLNSSDKHYSRGYTTLHDREATYTQLALERLRQPVESWYQYLTLYDEALRGEHESPGNHESYDHDSWELRLRLAVIETSTAKLALDAALAGYYAQALGLVRRMLEAWRMMVYARVRPDQAFRWLEPSNKTGLYPPNDSSITSEIKKYASKKDKGLHTNISVVNEKIRECNKGTHPSELGFAQMETQDDSRRTIGATYIEGRLRIVMSLGTLAMALILDEVKKVVQLNDQWNTNYDAAAIARAKWH